MEGRELPGDARRDTGFGAGLCEAFFKQFPCFAEALLLGPDLRQQEFCFQVRLRKVANHFLGLAKQPGLQELPRRVTDCVRGFGLTQV